MFLLNRMAVVVTAKAPFLEWLHAVDPASRDITLDTLNDEPSVYLLPECADDALFATDSGFEFLVQAGKCTPVVSAEGVEHGFSEV